jgi:hypothetical protein
MFLPNGALKKIVEIKYVPLGKTTPGKLLILLLCVWVRVQACLFPHYFLRKKGIRVMITMESLVAYRRSPRLSSAVDGVRGKPKLPSDVTRIRGNPRLS